MSMTLDEFKKAASATRVTCKICGFEAYALASHLQESHSLSVGQYQNRYQDAEVTSELVLAMMKRHPRERVSGVATFNKIWQDITDWNTKTLEELGKSMPSSSPELIPAQDLAFSFQEREMRILSMAVTEGMNLYISGPTECGKTSLVEQIHAYMGRPVLRCNMTGDTTIKNFLGQMQLNQQGTYFADGILLKAMRLGCTLLIDEIDFMPPHIGAVLHPVLEKGRSVYVPDLAQTVKAEKGFTVIATANTGGKGDRAGIYTGTEVLNTAFLDRFQLRLELDYLPQGVEAKVLATKFPTVKEQVIGRMLSFAQEVREAFKQGNIEMTLGTRKLEDFIRVREHMGIEDAYRLILTDWLGMDEKHLLDEIKARVQLI